MYSGQAGGSGAATMAAQRGYQPLPQLSAHPQGPAAGPDAPLEHFGQAGASGAGAMAAQRGYPPQLPALDG